MKAITILAAAALFVGMTGAAFAECDTHKGDRDTDKQTKCSEKCEDGFTSGTMVRLGLRQAEGVGGRLLRGVRLPGAWR